MACSSCTARRTAAPPTSTPPRCALAVSSVTPTPAIRDRTPAQRHPLAGGGQHRPRRRQQVQQLGTREEVERLTALRRKSTSPQSRTMTSSHSMCLSYWPMRPTLSQMVYTGDGSLGRVLTVERFGQIAALLLVVMTLLTLTSPWTSARWTEPCVTQSCAAATAGAQSPAPLGASGFDGCEYHACGDAWVAHAHHAHAVTATSPSPVQVPDPDRRTAATVVWSSRLMNGGIDHPPRPSR